MVCQIIIIVGFLLRMPRLFQYADKYKGMDSTIYVKCPITVKVKKATTKT